MGGPLRQQSSRTCTSNFKGSGFLAKGPPLKRLDGPDLLLPSGKTKEAFPVL